LRSLGRDELLNVVMAPEVRGSVLHYADMWAGRKRRRRVIEQIVPRAERNSVSPVCLPH
jgi:hypothetical protein